MLGWVLGQAFVWRLLSHLSWSLEGVKGCSVSIIRDGFQRFYLPKDLGPSPYSIFPSCDQRSFPFALYTAGATVTPKTELPRGQEAV
jgi:hypothetical protein